MLATLAVVWAVTSHRRLVVASYSLLAIEGILNAVMPLFVAMAIDGVLTSSWWQLGMLTVLQLCWCTVYWCRARLDTRAFDGAVNAACCRYLQITKDDPGSKLNNIRLAQDILVVLRYKLPRAISTWCFAVGAVVALTAYHWLLGLAAMAYLVAMVPVLLRMACVSARISAEIHANSDRLKEAVEAGKAEDILHSNLKLEVEWSDRDATWSTVQSATMGGLLVVSIAVMGGVGTFTAGMIAAVLTYMRAIDGAADSSITLAQLSAKAGDAARRLGGRPTTTTSM